MPLGVYISVPFCRTKCSYCNFASDVFSKSAYENYVRRVVEDITRARAIASGMDCELDRIVDSVYLGGGTPSILDGDQLVRIFDAVRREFSVMPDAEVTVECAPGTLGSALIETLLRCGVNRVSLGVQSFVDEEARAVGRLHTRAVVLEEVDRLRAAGIDNINVDLIAGLPHQTEGSWAYSLAETIALCPPHVSVYMLEVDGDSRLGRELIAGGTRYHAHFVPDEDATADFYQQACERLNAAGIGQYEISNFAREGRESRHNLKYWTREPYVGFGVDAHSMLPWRGEGTVTSAAKAVQEINARIAALKRCATQTQALHEQPEAIRLSTLDSLDSYVSGTPHHVTPVSTEAALEESFFLGLRLDRGVDLEKLRAEYSKEAIAQYDSTIEECLRDGLLNRKAETICLTDRGRLLSNEVFARFLRSEENSLAEVRLEVQEGGNAKSKVGTGNVNPR
jgi:oxygen-independent coproporphyrinogen III oxidase